MTKSILFETNKIFSGMSLTYLYFVFVIFLNGELLSFRIT